MLRLVTFASSGVSAHFNEMLAWSKLAAHSSRFGGKP